MPSRAMKLLRTVQSLGLVVGLAGGVVAQSADAQLTNGWTYQGELKNGSSLAEGEYDFQFRLFDAGGLQVGSMLCKNNVIVTSGRFVTSLDFGAIFTGQRLFLEIATRADTGLDCSNAASFLTLGPRQELTIAPYAGYALNAASAGTATNAGNTTNLGGQSSAFHLTRANHTGTLPSAALAGPYTSAITFSNPNNTITGIFSGTGSGLTGLSASNVSTGVLSIARGGTGSDTSAATNGQVLKFNGTVWVPGTDIDTNTTYTAGSGLLLSGTVFSVPTSGITSAMVLDNTLIATDIAPNAITNSELSSDVLSFAKVTGGVANIVSTNMGIGATALASAKLNVAGNLNVTGNTSIGGSLTTDAVVLPATARVYSVPMIAFFAYNNTNATTGSLNVDDVSVSYSSGNGVDRTLYAPVNLPHGAVVTGLYAHVEDASNTDLTVSLVRRGVDGSAGATMASTVSSGNVAGTRVFSDTVVSSSTIDNNTYAYSAKVFFAPTTLNPNAPILHGLRVTYTVTAPLP